MSEKSDLKNFSDIEELKNDFSSFVTERAFSIKSTFLDDQEYEDFEDRLTEEEITKRSNQEFEKTIAVYKRAFLDAILLFSK